MKRANESKTKNTKRQKVYSITELQTNAVKVLQRFARKVMKYQREFLKVDNPFRVDNYDIADLEDAFEKGDVLRFGWCNGEILKRMPMNIPTELSYLHNRDKIFKMFTSSEKYHTNCLIRYTINIHVDGNIKITFWPPDLNKWDYQICCLLEETVSSIYCYKLYFDKNLLSSFENIRLHVPIFDIISPYGYATDMKVKARIIEDDEKDVYSLPVGKQGEGGFRSTDRGTTFAEEIYKKHFYCRQKKIR